MPHRPLVTVAVAAVFVLLGCGGMPASEEPRVGRTTGSPSPSASPTDRATTPPAVAAAAYELKPFRPATYDDWLTEIPDGFRVDAFLPEDGGDFTRSRDGVGFTFCDEEAFPSDEVLDRATASVSGPEYGEGRDLRLFADDRAADRFQRDALAVVTACPEREQDGATWRHEARSSHLDGDASFTAVQSFFTYDGRPVLGATFWEVVRVGNAVLLTSTGGEFDPTTTLDPGIRDHAGDVAQIVEEMCVFAAEPCAGAG